MEDESRQLVRLRKLAYYYLGYKSRTVAQMREYLLRKSLSEDYTRRVVAELIDKGYLNDEQYAQAWIESQRRKKRWGSIRLRRELLRKGIDTRCVEGAIQQEDQESELQLAMDRGKKRYLRFCAEPWIKLERKLGSYLVREGFSRDIVYRVLGELRISHEEIRKE